MGDLSAAAIEQIVQRVFVERRETLDAAAQPYDVNDSRTTNLRLRESMALTVAALPEDAFQFQGGVSGDEAIWSAGQIVSHNADRLIGVLRQIALLIGTLMLEVPHSLERRVRTALFPLSSDESLAALEQSSDAALQTVRVIG